MNAQLRSMLCGIACLAACASEPVCDGPSGACRAGVLPAVDASVASDVQVDTDASAGVPCSADSPENGSGVRIHVEGDQCNFRYGQGGTFRYRVTVYQPISYFVPESSSCGFCEKLGSDVQPFTRVTVVSFGANELVSYCADCDVGCCPPSEEAAHRLAKQTYEGVLEWPARRFNGPSDTGQVPGAFFPVGPADVVITVNLPAVRDAVTTVRLPITIE